MSKIIQFGEKVAGYDIRVLNEREVRAAAGLFFLATFTSFLLILFTNNFVPVKYVLTVFFIDFLVRVLINPRFAPSLILGRLIVRGQNPEYVGAPQKRFAWSIGLILSSVMFTFLVVVNAYSPITGITCLVCLLFLFFETAFGICLGCKFYPLFFRKRVRYCPGEVCDSGIKQDIQKISVPQLLVIAGTALLLYVLMTFFNGYYSRKPYDLFELYAAGNNK